MPPSGRWATRWRRRSGSGGSRYGANLFAHGLASRRRRNASVSKRSTLFDDSTADPPPDAAADAMIYVHTAQGRLHFLAFHAAWSGSTPRCSSCASSRHLARVRYGAFCDGEGTRSPPLGAAAVAVREEPDCVSATVTIGPDELDIRAYASHVEASARGGPLRRFDDLAQALNELSCVRRRAVGPPG